MNGTFNKELDERDEALAWIEGQLAGKDEIRLNDAKDVQIPDMKTKR